MKINDLAKELNVTGKSIIAFLKDEIDFPYTSVMKAIDDETVDLVKKNKSKLEGADAKKTSGKISDEDKKEAPKAEKKEEAKPVEKAPEKPAEKAPAQHKEEVKKEAKPAEAVKKTAPKKGIVIVGGPAKAPANNNRPLQNNGNMARPQAPHQLIKPTTPPSKTPTANISSYRNTQENKKTEERKEELKKEEIKKEEVVTKAPEVKTEEPKVSAPVQNTQSQDKPKVVVNNNARPQNDNRPRDNRDNRDNRDRGDFRRNDNRDNGQKKDFGDRNNNKFAGRNDRPQKTSFGGSGIPNKDNDRNQRPMGNGGMLKKKGKDTQDVIMVSNDKNRNDKRFKNKEKDKNRKDYRFEDEDFGGKNQKKPKAGAFIKPVKKEETKVEDEVKVITVPEVISIKDLADKMKIQSSEIIKKKFLQGVVYTANQELSYEEAEEIALEYDILCEKEVVKDVIEELLKEEDEIDANLTERAPVICVMGHVDHGKTSLLDAIRETHVTDREAGGITQHIGAYMVEKNGRKITFLDTPGHEAFTAMRMRGANATDIAILVVAADDGVMPQTIEAINHAKAANVPIIVAVNKVDKIGYDFDDPNRDMMSYPSINSLMNELAYEHDLLPESMGGTTVYVPISAKKRQGIQELLDIILLSADILELKADAKRKARGLVIEARLDKGRGPVSTVLVQKGTLKVGDFISAGEAHGKVRAMINDKGERIKEAPPSTPVEIQGLDKVPNAGEIFIAHESDKEAKNFADTFIAQNKLQKIAESKKKVSLEELYNQIQTGNLKTLNLIVKADVQGSVEAVKKELEDLSNEEVRVDVIHSGVGTINESDVVLASAGKAIIIGFNVRIDAGAKETAEREGVDVKFYDVIYRATNDVSDAIKGMLAPVYEEKIQGHVEVRAIYKSTNAGNIAGCYVLDGIITKDSSVRITRAGEQIFEGKLSSLKRFKDDVKEVKSGFECGIVFDGFGDMQEFDIVEAYTMVEVPR